MENINLENLKFAVNGFLSSVSQTGSDLGTNLGSSISSLGDSISDKLPPQWTQVLPLSKPPPPPPQSSWLGRVSDWACENKKTAAFAILGTVSASFAGLYMMGMSPFGVDGRRVYCGRRSRRRVVQNRRLASRAETGGRKEVVLLVGSPNEPLVRLVAQDLDIRGFIVYVTATPSEEEVLARENSSDDICALRVDSYFDPANVKHAFAQLEQVLDTPVRAFPGAEPHKLTLAGIVLLPDLFYPIGPLESTSAPQWAQTVQSKVQMPLNFLVLGGISLARSHHSKFVLVTPGIVGALAPAFHAPEALVSGALSSLALALARELEPQGIPFTHLRLGSFDTRPLRMRSPSPPKHRNSPRSPGSHSPRSSQADILSWPEEIRRAYGARFRASTTQERSKGSSLRELYHGIFDTLTAQNPQRVVYVGKGSRVYDWVRACIPERVLSRLLAN